MRRRIKLCQIVLMSIAMDWVGTVTAQAANHSAFVEAMKAGDAAYNAFDNKAALEAFSRAVAMDSTNYEALLKLARAYIDVGQASKGDEQKQNYFTGEKLARRCVALHPDSAEGHFVLALAVGRVALIVGGKKKIELSQEVKKEAEAALLIEPDHNGAMHLLGRWHYELANLSWVLKAVAKVIYGGVPTGASNKQARVWFEKAIAIRPDVPVHHLWLGETLIKLGDYTNARQHLTTTLALDEVFWDDADNKAQAQQRLEEIKNKR